MQRTIEDFFCDSRKDALKYLGKKGRESQMKAVLGAFIGCEKEGATDAEIAAVLSIERTSVIARRHDIMKKFPDLLYVVGKRISSHGILCDVWKCKQ